MHNHRKIKATQWIKFPQAWFSLLETAIGNTTLQARGESLTAVGQKHNKSSVAHCIPEVMDNIKGSTGYLVHNKIYITHHGHTQLRVKRKYN